MFRIARIMRIFKLARRSVGLQAIAHTMKSSYKELGLLLMFVGMGMLIFGSLCYFAEKDVEDSSYTSIPQSMWWAIQTLTSVSWLSMAELWINHETLKVGYGDLSPSTVFGKLVGCVCAVAGVLVMALPIPIVVENFAAFYDDQKLQQVEMIIRNTRLNTRPCFLVGAREERSCPSSCSACQCCPSSGGGRACEHNAGEARTFPCYTRVSYYLPWLS